MPMEGHHLDPEDWQQYRVEMHAILDRCIERMESARDLPWIPKPEDLFDRMRLDSSEQGAGIGATFGHLTDDIMPYATGNTHPRFFGWVHGTGLPVSVGAELVAATMNSNCGGRDHGAVDVERAVLDWLLRIAGMPENASGILTTGTSQATILALATARRRLFGVDVKQTGIAGLPPVVVYVREGTHSCINEAMDVLGHGRASVRIVPTDMQSRMDVDALARMVTQDVAAGRRPMAVIATAGTVDMGLYDPIDRLADFCESRDLWLHVDGAFGFWIVLADAPWSALGAGIGRANSIACDFHKWMSVPYDCGACMIHDETLHLETFASRAPYLQSQESGLAGGELWFCDYGFDLSRGFRALKVWTALKAIGVEAFGAAVTDNCRQAARMADLVEASDVLRLARPVVSNLCCFSVARGCVEDIAARLQISGDAVFSTTIIDGEPCLRAAIVNHRTTMSDIEFSIRAVETLVREQLRPGGAV